jgi:hypothetical protein
VSDCLNPKMFFTTEELQLRSNQSVTKGIVRLHTYKVFCRPGKWRNAGGIARKQEYRANCFIPHALDLLRSRSRTFSSSRN